MSGPVRRVARLAAVLGWLASGLAVQAGDASVVYDPGHPLPSPETVTRVLAAGPPAAVLVAVLAPDRLLGWPWSLEGQTRALAPPATRDLPVVGRLTGRGGTAGAEAVAALHPDLIVDSGANDPAYLSLTRRIPEQTGIPYVLLDGRLADTAWLLARAGQLLGVAQRGQALADFTRQTLDDVTGRIAPLPADRRPSVYLARGADGLETGWAGSINAEMIETLGARNVARADDGTAIGRVSLEQVLRWDPDVILALSPAFLTELRRQPLWQSLRAVRQNRVFLVPAQPFGWIDGPPGVNRVVGLRWLARQLYPQLFPEDLGPFVRQFFQLFYGVTLDDQTLAALLTPP
jgi:iron complex transport system substrate-binding protein